MTGTKLLWHTTMSVDGFVSAGLAWGESAS
jgi:hypothetical protein